MRLIYKDFGEDGMYFRDLDSQDHVWHSVEEAIIKYEELKKKVEELK